MRPKTKCSELSDQEIGMAFSRCQHFAWALATANKDANSDIVTILRDFDRIVLELWPKLRAQVMIVPTFCNSVSEDHVQSLLKIEMENIMKQGVKNNV